jgi:esterase/lipase
VNIQAKRRNIAALSSILTALIATIMAWFRSRSTTRTLQTYTGHPAADYDDALARFAQIQAQEEANPLLNPLCRSKLLTHGCKMERAIVLMHGMTNCPHQYAQLATLFYERGYNVLIPLMPHNGLLDRETQELQHLTALQLRDNCNTMVDIARGLGERLSYAGLSVGGVMAAWVAQNRADVEKAVVISPAFTVDRHLGTLTSRLVMYLLLLLPNLMTQRFRPFKEGPPYNYRGFATHGLAQTMRLGFSVYDAARKTAPAAHSVLVITNAADPSVNNTFTQRLLARWNARKPASAGLYEFEASHHFIHDIIDPLQPQQQTAQIYPILLDLITGELHAHTDTGTFIKIGSQEQN